MKHEVAAMNRAEGRSPRGGGRGHTRGGRPDGRPDSTRALLRVLVAAAVLAQVYVCVAWAVAAYREYDERRDEVARLERALRELREQNRRLAAEREALLRDDRIEQLARERLGLVKPGEKAYIVISGRKE